MQLRNIKIAGFKSFVDPVNIHLPGNRVGIVGPNGCGKSNVIDAVRWVLGESSARMLRGESMADVIFNGSANRKPVGMASIELIFDNSAGRIVEEYANYAEISVRRQVTRDGESQYLLNGRRCRRRDITDLFLGTGLGPRSYAIIEQGMISRLIEARPDELRQFLEEAAGISRYKERRRETERRIQHTRENLDRLNDLRTELSKRLGHLEEQAHRARRYRELKGQQRELQGQLYALRWRALSRQLEEQQGRLRQRETELELELAGQRHVEADLEAAREAYAQCSEEAGRWQGEFYEQGAAIARLEQSLNHAREECARTQRALDQARDEAAGAERHQVTDEERLEQLETDWLNLEPELALVREREEAGLERQQQVEEAQQQWQQAWDVFNREAVVPGQTAQVERARMNQLEQQLQQLRRRRERLEEERSRFAESTLRERLNQLNDQESDQREQLLMQQEALELLEQELGERRLAGETLAKHHEEVRLRLQHALGREATLRSLQQQALGQDRPSLELWLEARGLRGQPRLADMLQAPAEWGRAVELVLKDLLSGVLVEHFDHCLSGVTALADGLSLVDETWQETAFPAYSLAAQVQGPAGLRALLAGVRPVAGLMDALELREHLLPGEYCITPEGTRIGRQWLCAPDSTGAYQGVLERAQELQALVGEITSARDEAEALSASVQDQRRALQGLEAQRGERLQQLKALRLEHTQLAARLGARRSELDQVERRRAQLEQELQETLEQEALDHAAMEQSRQLLHRTLGAIESFTERREQLVRERDRIRDQLTERRAQVAQLRRAHQDLAVRQGSLGSALEGLRQSLARSREVRQNAQQRHSQLGLALEQLRQPLAPLQQELQEALQQRLVVERTLTAAREAVAQADQRVRDLDRQRHQREQQAHKQRALVDEARLRQQELQVRSETAWEQLQATRLPVAEVLETLPAEAQPEVWERQLKRLDREIEELGVVNLTAIDEFQEELKRKEYLDFQFDDLTRSLETLEQAIKRIDKETKERFRETYDRVNQGLSRMFPKLFGGGAAYLDLIGEDLLDAGVSIMARPPGKRNASIALLSGGEKALTAVALVFSIFELNPAPFCMLDEVDAPLDDANVGRFCELVKEMSSQVQFIFITHNKVTMEMANQLTGVTMHEPGVSRLVSVDIEEAVEMAAA